MAMDFQEKILWDVLTFRSSRSYIWQQPWNSGFIWEISSNIRILILHTCYRSHLTWCFRMSLHFRFRCCWHQQQHKHLSKVEGPSLHIEATMDQQPLWLDEFRIENCEIWHGGVQDNPKLIWFFHWLYYGVFPTGCCRETYQTCKTKTIKTSSKGISSSKHELRIESLM